MYILSSHTSSSPVPFVVTMRGMKSDSRIVTLYCVLGCKPETVNESVVNGLEREIFKPEFMADTTTV